MIIKCLRKFKSGEQWILFDGFDKITYQVIPNDMPIAVGENVEDLTISNLDQPSNQGKNPKKELWLFKDGESIKQIIAYSPIYILNDEGKTIERI